MPEMAGTLPKGWPPLAPSAALVQKLAEGKVLKEEELLQLKQQRKPVRLGARDFGPRRNKSGSSVRGTSHRGNCVRSRFACTTRHGVTCA